MNDTKISEGILENYREKKDVYESFWKKTVTAFQTMLKDKGIVFGGVERGIVGRLKTEESLKGKLQRKEGKYKELEDITDLYGIRISLFNESDIHSIKEIIEKMFYVEALNSSDKGKFLGTDQFGYRSVHYIVKLVDSLELKLKQEWKEYENLKVEIQVRTALQDIWASTEHELVYKRGEIPTKLQRKYAQLAALFEMADENLSALRESIQEYREDCEQKIGILREINEETYKQFIDSQFYKAYFQDILDQINIPILSGKKEEFGFNYINVLDYIGVTTTSELQKILIKNKEKLIKIGNYFTLYEYDPNQFNGMEFHFQAPIIYLGYIENIVEQSQFNIYLDKFNLYFKNREDTYRELFKLINE